MRDWKPFHTRPVTRSTDGMWRPGCRWWRTSTGRSPRTGPRATLSAFYAWAIGQGLADINPVIGTDRAGIERSRERVLSAAEIRSVWAAAGEDDHGRILKLLLLTGQRRGEVAGMTWGELDLDKAVWSMPAQADQERPAARRPAVARRR